MSQDKPEPQQVEESRPNTQREEFRKYLEQNGVMETLTRALSELYLEKEKPSDALDYIKCYLNDNRRPQGEVSVLRESLKNTRAELKAKEQEVSDLKKRLDKYEEVDEPKEI